MEVVEPIRDKKDIKRMKEVLLKQSYRNYFMFTLGINVGLRVPDLLLLKVKDVRNKDNIYMRNNKTNRDNRFPIIPELKEEINKYTQGMNEEEYLFQSKKCPGKSLNYDAAYRIIKKAATKIGLEHVGSLSMRKTFGYHHYKRTNDIAFLMEVFNHSSKHEFLRYIGIDIDLRRESLEGGFL